MYLAEEGLSDDELEQRLGFDRSEILSVRQRISEGFKQEGPAGRCRSEAYFGAEEPRVHPR